LGLEPATKTVSLYRPDFLIFRLLTLLRDASQIVTGLSLASDFPEPKEEFRLQNWEKLQTKYIEAVEFWTVTGITRKSS
jgi:hypothetical protein